MDRSSTRLGFTLGISLALGGLVTAGCGSSAPATPVFDAGPDALMPPDLPRTMTEAQLAPMRSSCAFTAGAWAAQTIGTDYKIGADIPVKHVMVIMEENRSFDHYFGQLVAQGYYSGGDFTPGGSGFSHTDQLDGPPAGWSNPDGSGGTITPHPDNEYCYSVDHSWVGQHNDWDNGKNDGFVIQNNPDGERTFFYEDDTVIPFYYALAKTFSVGDRYFCSALTSTWPNRLFMMAGTSFGIGDNSFVELDTAANPAPQILSLLVDAGHTWKDYSDGPHQESFFPVFGFLASTQTHLGDIKCNLLNDIMNNDLPDVSLVMGDEVTETSDEGPPDLPGIGATVVEQIIRTLFASPAWKDTVVFIVYDENGGFADHVPPAAACPPDSYPAHDQNGMGLPGDFTTTGFRVPFIVVSPYAKAHYVSHTVYDHTSILRFIESRFGLPALTERDANATPPMDIFDFDNPAFTTPPTISATTTVDPNQLSMCGQELPYVCDD